MAVNLSRNTKVFITTTADNATNFTNTDTFAIDVLNGYSFNQQADSQTINLQEAGTSPVRSSRAFNTKLNPVDWKFSTYIRPYLSTNHTCVERLLWQYAFDDRAPDVTGVAVTTVTASATTTGAIVTFTSTHGFATGTTSADIGRVVYLTGATQTEYNVPWTIATVPNSTTFTAVYPGLAALTSTAPTLTTAKIYKSALLETPTSARISTMGSNRNTLQSFGLIFQVDNSVFRVNSCAVDGANINFDLQGIATIDWNGFGTTLNQFSGASLTSAQAALTTINAVNALASKYITNKLSTTVFKSGIEGSGTTGGGANNKTYSVPITGGSISIKNNVQYVTPETLGKVNSAIGYFTGNRQVSGSLQAYLKTATNETAELLTDVLTGVATTTEPKFYLEVDIGGATNTTARVNLKMPAVTISVPSVEVQDVISTTINFTAQSYQGSSFDLSFANELLVSYFGS